MRNISLLTILAIALASCRLGANENYPTSARQMLEVEFPADGRAHIQRRGTFRIRPDTNFCTYRPGFGLDEQAAREGLAVAGQVDDPAAEDQANGAFGEGSSPECRDPLIGNPIFARGLQSPNRAGQPYKITLAVWQGSAVWVGVVERSDGLRSDAVAQNVPVNDGPGFFLPTQAALRKKARQEDSFRRDVIVLSRIFFKDVEGNSK